MCDLQEIVHVPADIFVLMVSQASNQWLLTLCVGKLGIDKESHVASFTSPFSQALNNFLIQRKYFLRRAYLNNQTEVLPVASYQTAWCGCGYLMESAK